jgi:hypothetical protein
MITNNARCKVKIKSRFATEKKKKKINEKKNFITRKLDLNKTKKPVK